MVSINIAALPSLSPAGDLAGDYSGAAHPALDERRLAGGGR
jgi:hypothetical protein